MVLTLSYPGLSRQGGPLELHICMCVCVSFYSSVHHSYAIELGALCEGEHVEDVLSHPLVTRIRALTLPLKFKPSYVPDPSLIWL